VGEEYKPISKKITGPPFEKPWINVTSFPFKAQFL
jgi:hypothetical protein